MKIVLDTNILISAVISKTGLAPSLLLRSLNAHKVILSNYILNEFEEKLLHKIELPQNIIDRSLRYIKARSEIYNPADKKDIQFKDPKDWPILALAREAKVHYLVTGDKALLELKKFEGTFIISLREAVERL